jgi:hypothetical protein
MAKAESWLLRNDENLIYGSMLLLRWYGSMLLLASACCETGRPFVLVLVLDFCRNEYRAFHSSI